MRLCLKLCIDRSSGDLLPMNYRYELASAIYKILSQYDKHYADKLHGVGYASGSKRFKLFGFSDLYIPLYRIEGDRMRILGDYAEWTVSFFSAEGTSNFIKGVLQGRYFSVADKISRVVFRIDDIVLLPEPELKDTMRFHTISPVCVSELRQNATPVYLSPEHPKYRQALLDGVLSRYAAACGVPYEKDVFCDFELLSVPKPVLTTIKSGTPQQTRVKGYRYDCRVSLPEELMRLVYDCGLGEKNSLGFGMVKII